MVKVGDKLAGFVLEERRYMYGRVLKVHASGRYTVGVLWIGSVGGKPNWKRKYQCYTQQVRPDGSSGSEDVVQWEPYNPGKDYSPE